MDFEFIGTSPEIIKMAQEAEAYIAPQFAEIDAVAEYNTAKVLAAFRKNRLDEACFAGTTGYGYDDRGREVLDKVWADVFGAEQALVRIGFVNGTHAITAALFSAVRPGDILLSATGRPYDTLQSVIGITGNYHGSLKYYDIDYREAALDDDGKPNLAAIKSLAADEKVTAVEIQRSRGYSSRDSLSVAQIGEICDAIRSVNKRCAIIVDNCYGEFVERAEPNEVGADLIAGSLIKNPGGGIAPTGGYVAGRPDLVNNAAMRATTAGIGGECGSTLGNNRLLFQGLFLAPHTTAQALKTAVFCARMMELLGCETWPSSLTPRHDIVQTITLGSAEKMELFCRGIQLGAPVSSYVTPVPWKMPGYEDEVIMAAGAFIQGASIELSADGPMREPYTAYLQGGLTYESGKLGIMAAAELMLKAK